MTFSQGEVKFQVMDHGYGEISLIIEMKGYGVQVDLQSFLESLAAETASKGLGPVLEVAEPLPEVHQGRTSFKILDSDSHTHTYSNVPDKFDIKRLKEGIAIATAAIVHYEKLAKEAPSAEDVAAVTQFLAEVRDAGRENVADALLRSGLIEVKK